MEKIPRNFWAWWKGELNQGPRECIAKVLTNESFCDKVDCSCDSP